jgi:ABC-type sugar transport system substrate-binding protein
VFRGRPGRREPEGARGAEDGRLASSRTEEMDVTNDEARKASRGWLRTRWMATMLAMAVGLAACGGSDSGDTGGSGESADAGTTTAAAAEKPAGKPYEVAGSDSSRPALQLQGWVPGGKASKEYKIAYFGNTPLNTYVQAMEYGAETAAGALGVKLEKVIAKWDSAQQLNQLETAVQQKKYDGIVAFAADPNAECRVLKQQVPDAGIPVVITNFPLCGDSDFTEGTVGVSTSQSLPFYRQYVEWAFGELSKKGGGKVGILSGPAAFGHAKQLKKASEEIVKKYENVTIAQNLNAEWTTAGGLKQAETLMQTHPDLKMLLSSYDQNTIGAVKALKAAGKKPGDLMIFNLGGDKVSFPLMKDGWIQGTQYLQPIEEVGQAVEMLVAKLDGAKTPEFNNLGDGKSHPAGTAQITLENMDQFKPQF